LGAPWGLPEALEVRAAKWGASPSYDELYERANQIVHDPTGAMADRLFVIEHSRGPSAQPQHSEIYTYRTWWHSRGPEATAAKTHLQIGQVRAPILLVQGNADIIVAHEEAFALADIARAAGNDRVQVSIIDGADHFFGGREFSTIETVVRWMRHTA
jgi:alpha-beta hydrolase superfamily lysophospholipase